MCKSGVGPVLLCRFAVLFSYVFSCLFAVLSRGFLLICPRGLGQKPSQGVWDAVPGGLGPAVLRVPRGMGQSRGDWDKNCGGGSGSVPWGLGQKLSRVVWVTNCPMDT